MLLDHQWHLRRSTSNFSHFGQKLIETVENRVELIFGMEIERFQDLCVRAIFRQLYQINPQQKDKKNRKYIFIY